MNASERDGTARGPAPEGAWQDLNRAWWDERVPLHLASDFYGLDAFRAGEPASSRFEFDELGDVADARLVHLQCHIGLDTLHLARRGARVTGLDFSAPAIEAAQRLAQDVGASDARFVVADVHDAHAAIAGAGIEPVFDVVFTGVGALCWLPDMDRWAQVVASLLAPGGRFYIAEFHPFADVLDDATGTTVVRDYFSRDADAYEASGTYADPDAPTRSNAAVEWLHGLGDVVSALVRAGLRIDFVREHDRTYFARFASLERRDGGFRFPAGRPRVPLMYSIQATKPRD